MLLDNKRRWDFTLGFDFVLSLHFPLSLYFRAFLQLFFDDYGLFMGDRRSYLLLWLLDRNEMMDRRER